MIRYGPGGITAVDYDNDGFYDLFIPDGVESKLYRNRGDGTFEDVTRQAGLAGLDGVSVAVFADYDNDGHKDLFVSRTFRPNKLFHNNGDGTFRDVTKQSGIGEDCCTTVASWADYDNDGLLDLYVGRYLDPRTKIPTTFYARNGEPNQLYHNNGDGTFTNVTEKAGVGEKGLCLGSVWGDYDGDGFPDLYVVNDFGRKTLYHNNRNGTFTDVTVKSGTLAYGAGLSASFADFDNDGWLDIYAADGWVYNDKGTEIELDFLNNVVSKQKEYKTGIFFDPKYFGKTSWHGWERNRHLRNNGDGTFTEMGRAAGTDLILNSRGVAVADFWNRGVLDIAVEASTDRHVLLRNEVGEKRNWL